MNGQCMCVCLRFYFFSHLPRARTPRSRWRCSSSTVRWHRSTWKCRRRSLCSSRGSEFWWTASLSHTRSHTHRHSRMLQSADTGDSFHLLSQRIEKILVWITFKLWGKRTKASLTFEAIQTDMCAHVHTLVQTYLLHKSLSSSTATGIVKTD